MARQKVTKHSLGIAALDIVLLALCGALALLARFEFSFSAVPALFWRRWLLTLPIQICVTLTVFWFRRMYHYVWHAVNARDVLNMLASALLAAAISLAFTSILGLTLPRSVQFMTVVLQVAALVGERCVLRFYDALHRAAERRSAPTPGERILLIGAGEAGRVLLRESICNADAGRICCVVDDDREKWGKYLGGVPIVGGRDAIPDAVKRRGISQIVFAIPSLPASEKRKILAICQETGCRLRILPEIYRMMEDSITMAAVKDVQMEDLLGRDPVRLDTEMLDGFLRGKTVLVTGGGGSIGSELCRQIAPYEPGKLIILDIYENNAYDIQQELHRRYGAALDLRVEIASVRDKAKIERLFDRYRPDIVFHAAAHKHVPLMEDCAEEAVKNNIFGTYHVVRAAEKYGVKKFVMISTDKAVNPTNVMGASKRFCEMILQSRPAGETEFCSVRFGNVLGSNGSVVPLFQKQIEEGGPVTVTDKRITRYFMTISEASQLVLEAGAMARRSQIFVLDMGEPVRILDLAENLIRLSGLEPYKDIEIREIGLRPGEKLYEELLMRSETLSATPNAKIFVEQQQTISAEEIAQALAELDRAVTAGADLRALLRRLVPTYRSPEEVNPPAMVRVG